MPRPPTSWSSSRRTDSLTLDRPADDPGTPAVWRIRRETTDEDPERVALVARLTTAWLRTGLLGDDSWATAGSDVDGLGRVDTKAA